MTSSNPTAVPVPTVTVRSGTTAASLYVATKPVAVETVVTLTATLGTIVKSADVKVLPPNLILLTVPRQITGGTTASGKVSLNVPAPPGGIVVNLASSNNSLASVPATVLIPPGELGITFPIQTTRVTTSTTLMIKAVAGTKTIYVYFNVNP
jgi:hypothetical protein